MTISAPDSHSALIELIDITKRFPGVLANDRVSLTLRRGEIHTLLGENGAGKSTLMKMLYGLLQPESGMIRLKGEPVTIQSPAQAIQLGIGMIHQHFMLVPSLTVTENVALGLGGGLALGAVRQRLSALSDQYGLKVDPNAYIWQLSVGEQQRVEILKALYRDAQLLILDEPTAVLTPQEVTDLFKVLRRMAENGCGLVFISHKLYEVLAISDRISVLRDGRVVGSTLPTEATRDSLVQMMVGREVSLTVERPSVALGSPRLQVTGLTALSDRRTPALKNISLTVHAGEIVGIAGVSGNGQRELSEVIGGLRPLSAGKIQFDDTDVTHATVRERVDSGLAYVPEERMKDGAIRTFSVQENAILQRHMVPPLANRGILNFKAIRAHTQHLIESFNVKTPTQGTPLRNLSGGNIQKLILARELSRSPKVLVAAQPTRGVDIGATLYIHGRLTEQRNTGTATLLISEDLDEVIALSDRIAVLYEGEIRGILPRGEATPERLGILMAGGEIGFL
jgi:simple sugar transport system ATP-binding protein